MRTAQPRVIDSERVKHRTFLAYWVRSIAVTGQKFITCEWCNGYILIYIMFLNRVCNQLSKRRVPYALVGGHAVALHGAVRGTVDLDFVIRWSKTNLEKAVQALGECGLVSRSPIGAQDVYHFRDEYIRNRNLIAWNFYNPQAQAEQVDLLINYDLGEQKTKAIKTTGGSVKVLNIDDLIAMKRASGREQDLKDAQALEKLK